MVDDRIVEPKSLRYAALNALHFGHPGINKMCSDAAIFWWPNMRERSTNPLLLTAVDKNSRYPEAKICKNTNHKTVISFLNEYINAYGVPKQIKLNRAAPLSLKNTKNFVNHKIKTAYTKPQTYIPASDWSNKPSNH